MVSYTEALLRRWIELLSVELFALQWFILLYFFYFLFTFLVGDSEAFDNLMMLIIIMESIQSIHSDTRAKAYDDK